jgi:hypothetical protein
MRRYAPFGMEHSMVVSINVCEKTGPVSQLVGEMGNACRPFQNIRPSLALNAPAKVRVAGKRRVMLIAGRSRKSSVSVVFHDKPCWYGKRRHGQL